MFFVFSNGVKLFIDTRNFDEAVREIRTRWYADIFEECDFEVHRATGYSGRLNK